MNLNIKNLTSLNLVLVILGIISTTCFVSTSAAADRWWLSSGSGNWQDKKWYDNPLIRIFPTTVQPGDNAFIKSGMVVINSNIQTALLGDLTVGIGGVGGLIIDGTARGNGAGVIGTLLGTGNVVVNKTGQWQMQGDLTIGNTGTGSLDINGGQVTNQTGIIGSKLGSGTVTVESGNWINSGDLTVGDLGTGLLKINGGQVIDQTGIIGNGLGSTGTVTVNGNGQWINNANLYIGENGTGTLNINESGLVANQSAVIGNALGSVGTVTVKDHGQWNNTGNLYIGGNGGDGNGNGTLVIRDNAAVNVSGTVNLGGLHDDLLDNRGSGKLELYGGVLATQGLLRSYGDASLVLNGGTIRATADNADFFSGLGSLNITGANLDANRTAFTLEVADTATAVTATNSFLFTPTSGTVGQRAFEKSGAGTLILSGSSNLKTGNLYVNGGTLNLTGTVNDYSTDIGEKSTDAASVIITDRGRLHSGDNLIVAASGSAYLHITGTSAVATDSNSYVGLGQGSHGTAAVDNSSLWETANLSVGYHGTGSLAIQDSGSVSDNFGYIGTSTDGYGSVTVSGNGSWQNKADLSVGSSGTGSLTIQDYGHVKSQTVYIGYDPSSFGTVTIGDHGSLVTNSSLVIGKSGTGSLDMQNTGGMETHDATIGADASGVGNVTASGDGYYWNNMGTLTIGASGTGTLTLQGHGSVYDDKDGVIGATSTGYGTVKVTDTSSWNNSGNLTVGDYGKGILDIENAGSVNDASASIGANPNSSGSVAVGGTGSWTSNGVLTIGKSGTGFLSIDNYGCVTSNGAIIGDDASGLGTVTISNTGYWYNHGNLVIGRSGTGSLVLNDDASAVFDGSVILGEKLKGSGTLVFNSANASLVGTDLSSPVAITSGSGRGTVIFNYAGNGKLGSDISGNNLSVIKQGSGTTTLSGGLSYHGLTDVQAGNLITTRDFTTANLMVSASGQLEAKGNLTLSTGGTTSLAIGNQPNILVSKTLALDGNTLAIDGYSGNPNTTYVLAQSSTLTGSFANVIVNGTSLSQIVTQDSFLVGSVFTESNNVVAKMDLVWFDSATDSAHGTFNINDGQVFNLGANLVVNTNTNAYAYGWDGKTLTKEGAGALILSGSSTIGDIRVDAGLVFITNYLSSSNGYIAANQNNSSNLQLRPSVIASGTWDSGSNLVDSGILFISDNGLVLSSSAVVNHDGAVFMIGQANWQNSGTLTVGSTDGSGLIQLFDHATLHTSHADIADGQGSSGDVQMYGNSRWQNQGELEIGKDGNGSLALYDQAAVSSGQIVLGASASGTGTLFIASADAQLTNADGHSSVDISSGDGKGSVIFAQTGSMAFADTLSGQNLQVEFLSGTTTLATANSYQGNTTIDGGAVLRGGTTNIIAQSNMLDIKDGGTFDLGESNQTLQNLNNNGLVTFGMNGRTLTVQQNLSGNGAFHVDANITAHTNDLIRINGDADGTHQVFFTGEGGLPTGREQALTVVSVGGINHANFSGGLDAGAFAYGLQRSGNDFVLTRQGFSSTGNAIMGIPGAQSVMWFSQQDNITKRMGDLRLGGQQLSDSWLNNIWVRSYGEESDVNTGVTGRSFDVDLWGIDLGTDKAWQIDSRNQLFTGVFFGYGQAYQDFRDSYGSNGESDSISGGLYLSWLEQSGWYADAVFKVAHFDNNFEANDQSYNQTKGDYDNWGIGGSLELGKQFRLDEGCFVEPMVQVSYTHLTGGNYNTTEANPVNVDQRDSDILQFRGGARMGRNIKLNQKGGILQPYLKMALMEQISSNGDVNIGGFDWRPNMDGISAELGCGVVWQLDKHNQLHLDYEAAFGSKYDKPWGFNFGYLYQF